MESSGSLSIRASHAIRDSTGLAREITESDQSCRKHFSCCQKPRSLSSIPAPLRPADGIERLLAGERLGGGEAMACAVFFPNRQLLRSGWVLGPMRHSHAQQMHQVAFYAVNIWLIRQGFDQRGAGADLLILLKKCLKVTQLRMFLTMLPKRRIPQGVEFVVQREEVADFIPGPPHE